MLNKLKTYLKNEDAASAIVFFKEKGLHELLCKKFDAAGATQRNLRQTLTALADYIADQEKIESRSPSPADSTIQQDYSQKLLEDKRRQSATFYNFNNQARSLYRNYDHLKMTGFGREIGAKVRHANALKILAVREQISKILDARDAYVKTGKIFDFNTEVDTHNPYEVAERINSLRVYISRYKNKPEKRDKLIRFEKELEYLYEVKKIWIEENL